MIVLHDAKVWILTDGKPGHANQCLGLAGALGLKPKIKRIAPTFPWSKLPPQLWQNAISASDPDGNLLTPPWPDILIAAGRQTVAPALAIKSANFNRTFCVQVQDPVAWRRRFDVIIAPRHDRLSGDNVVQTVGALTGITRLKLDEAAARLSDTLASLPRPLIAVLIGGSNKQYRMTKKSMTELADGLRRLSIDNGAGLAITTSRRTNNRNESHLRKVLRGSSNWIWDGQGDNPYLGLLALADAMVVTADSVSMVSEACSTGKPVFVADLEGGSKKFNFFHDHLRSSGITRPFSGTFETWGYDALRDTELVAEEVARRYDACASPSAAS